MKIPNVTVPLYEDDLSLARIVSEDSQLYLAVSGVPCKSSKDS